jgi:hypothetical protein
MKLITLSIISTLLLCFSSCDKEYAPYVKFKQSNYKKIKSDIVDVNLGSEYNLIIENGYKSTPPVFAIQKNADPEQVISNSNITQESQGWNEKKGLILKTVRVHLNFHANNFNVGDQLKVLSRHIGITEFLVFRIK